MKRVLAAFLAIVALGAQAKADNNVRTSAQPLNTSVANGVMTFDLFANETLMGAEITGLTAAGATLTIEGSTDGRPVSSANKVWFSTVAIPFTCPSPATFTTINADAAFKLDVSGLTNIRFRVSSTGTGNALVSVNAIPASSLGSCGGSGGGGGSGTNVNIHDSAGGTLNSTGGALNVAGTFSATLGGFTPSSSGARMAALTVQLTDSSQTLPTGAVTVVDNTDTTNPMYCNVNGVAATTSDKEIPPSSWFAFTIPATITTLHCIATGAPVVAHGLGGAGLPTGAGGGGGGGSSGGNVTIIGPLGTQAIAASVAVTPATSSVWPISASSLPLPAGAATQTTLAGVLSALGSPMQNSGGTVGISGTLPAFGSTPTVNLGTLGGAATAANQEVTTAGASATSAQGVQGVTGGIHIGSNTYDGSGNAISSTAGALNVAGSFSASIGSFQPNGGYLTVASITNTSANSALPAGSTGNNVVLYNYGGYKIIYALSTSGASTVTQATADGVLQPGATIEVSVGSNTNIAYMTTTATLTSSLQVVSGTGLWTGSGNNSISVGQLGLTTPNFATEIAGADNSNVLQAWGMTAAGTSSTKSVGGIQGVTGGVPVPISGSVTATFSQFAPNGNFSTPLAVGAASARTPLPGGGGTTIAVYNTGAYPAFVALGSSSVAATTSNDQVAAGGFNCFAVGANTNIAAIETAGATSLNISGGSGGCAGSGGGGSGGSPDTNLPLAGGSLGPITAANNFSTGLQVTNWQNGRVTLSGTPTSGSVLAFSGLAGWNSGQLECQSGGTQGTNHYSVVVSGPSGGPTGVVRRVATFTGPTASIPLNVAGQTFVDVIADAWSSGGLTCQMRVSVNQAVPDDASVQTLSQQTKPISFATGPTAVVLLPAVAGEMQIVNAANFMAGGTTNFTVEYGTQATNPCDTGTTTLTGAYPLTAQQGGSLPAGSQWIVPPGNQLCGIASVNAIQISGGLSFAFH